MYIEAYRFMLTLASLPVVVLLAIAGYSVAGPIGALIAGGVPFALLVKFLYFQARAAEPRS